jgi:hypothetical protein
MGTHKSSRIPEAASPLWLRLVHSKLFWVSAGLLLVLVAFLLHEGLSRRYNVSQTSMDSEEARLARQTVQALIAGGASKPPAIGECLVADIHERKRREIAAVAARLSAGGPCEVVEIARVGPAFRVRVTSQPKTGQPLRIGFYMVRQDDALKIAGIGP